MSVRSSLEFYTIQVLQVGVDVIQVLNEALTGEEYQQLSAELRQVVAGNADATRRLIQEFGATFAAIQVLSEDGFRRLVQNLYAIEQLVNSVHVPFNDILALDEGMRALVLEKHYAIEQLVNSVHVPFNDILALDEGMRALVLEKHYAIEQLVNSVHEVTFDRLTELSLENLTTVLAHPNSAQAQEILHPPQSNYSPRMF